MEGYFKMKQYFAVLRIQLEFQRVKSLSDFFSFLRNIIFINVINIGTD